MGIPMTGSQKADLMHFAVYSQLLLCAGLLVLTAIAARIDYARKKKRRQRMAALTAKLEKISTPNDEDKKSIQEGIDEIFAVPGRWNTEDCSRMEKLHNLISEKKAWRDS